MKSKLFIVFTISIIIVSMLFFLIEIDVNALSNVKNSNYIDEIKEEKIVILKGTMFDFHLEKENYYIASNDLNVFEIGSYTINYVLKETVDTIDLPKKIITRVIVIDEGSTVFNESTLSIKLRGTKYDYKIIASTILDDETEAVLVDLIAKDEVKLHNYFWYLVKDGKIINSQIVYINTTSELIGLTFQENELIFFGNTYNRTSKDKDLFFISYLLNHEYNYVDNVSYTYGGFGLETIEHIFITQNYYYIIGTTTTTNSNFEGARESEDSFVLVLTKTGLNISYVKMLGIMGSDYIEKGLLYNNYLYLVRRSDQYHFTVLKLDLFGNIINEVNENLQYGSYTKELLVENDLIKLITYEYCYETMSNNIYCYNFNCDLIFNKNLVFENVIDNIIDLKTLENNLLVLLIQNERNMSYQYLVYQKSDLIFSNTFSDKKPIKILGKNKSFILAENNDCYIIVDNLKYLKLDDEIIIDNNIVSNNETYIIDDTSNKIISDESELFFGKYYKQEIYNTDNTFFYIKESLFVIEPQTNVINDNIYDIGFVLKFNGLAYLNGSKIDNNYILNNPGKYTLELIGKDNLSYSMNFIVKNLSNIKEENEYKNNSNNNLNLTVLPSENKDNSNEVLINFKSSDLINNKNNNYTWSYIIPLTFATLGAFIIFKVKY